MNKIKKIVFLAVLLMLIIVSIYFWIKNKPKELQLSTVEVSKCYTQYRSCEFAERSSEDWEIACDPVFKEVKVVGVGDFKILIEDNNKNQMIYPKNFFILSKPKKSENSIYHSSFWYESTCQNNSLEEDKKQIIVEKSTEKKEVLDKCFALSNDCSIKERWLEDQLYCHPYKKVYKILEEGALNYRVIVWHGHGETFKNKPFQVKQHQESLLKEEFNKLNYNEVDCFDLMNKYKESFNPITGK